MSEIGRNMVGAMFASAASPLIAPAMPITDNHVVLVMPLKCLAHLTDFTLLLPFLAYLSGDRSLLRC